MAALWMWVKVIAHTAEWRYPHDSTELAGLSHIKFSPTQKFMWVKRKKSRLSLSLFQKTKSFIGLAIGAPLLVSCNSPDAAVPEESDPIPLMKVDKNFSEPPVDWTTFGRSENMYVLTYAMDIKLCSIIGNALNVEYIPNTYFDAQQSVGGELYIKNPLSVKWVNLGNSPSGVTQYTPADIDHDGKQELLVRRSYTRNRLVQSINKYDAKHEELFLSAKYQYPTDDFVDQQVLRVLYEPESIGMVKDQKIYRDDGGVLIQTKYAMGQTTDIVEVNGMAYILSAPNGDRVGESQWPVNILQYLGEDRFVNLCSFASRF